MKLKTVIEQVFDAGFAQEFALLFTPTGDFIPAEKNPGNCGVKITPDTVRVLFRLENQDSPATVAQKLRVAADCCDKIAGGMPSNTAEKTNDPHISFWTEDREDGSIVIHAERTVRFATCIARRSELPTEEREAAAKDDMRERIECGMAGFRKALREMPHSNNVKEE
jgi:hypothetical protein